MEVLTDDRSCHLRYNTNIGWHPSTESIILLGELLSRNVSLKLLRNPLNITCSPYREVYEPLFPYGIDETEDCVRLDSTRLDDSLHEIAKRLKSALTFYGDSHHTIDTEVRSNRDRTNPIAGHVLSDKRLAYDLSDSVSPLLQEADDSSDASSSSSCNNKMDATAPAPKFNRLPYEHQFGSEVNSGIIGSNNPAEAMGNKIDFKELNTNRDKWPGMTLLGEDCMIQEMNQAIIGQESNIPFWDVADFCTKLSDSSDPIIEACTYVFLIIMVILVGNMIALACFYSGLEGTWT